MEQVSSNAKIKYGLIVILSLIVLFALYYFLQPKPEAAIGEDLGVIIYTKGGQATGGMFTVPFLTAYSDAQGVYVSAAVDLNSNQIFEPDEWLVKNTNTQTQQDWNTNLSFKTDKIFSSEAKVRVMVSQGKASDADLTKSKNVKEKTVAIATQSLDELLGATPPTKPGESMKQGGTATGQQSNAASPNGVPDFGQRIDECAPTVAANGLYSLAMKNGATAKLPQNPLEMIDGLKGDMLWTAADGVVPDTFVAGKDKWAVTHGLPIKTEMIGDFDGRGSLDAIKAALAKGATVEMRLRFSDADLNVVGGHVVTVVGVREVAGQTFIDMHDPLSPTGTESYVVSANSLESYPFYKGDVSVGIGFAEYWQGPPMGGELDVMTEEEMRGIREFAGEKKTIKALHVGDKYIPLTEVHIGQGDHCDGPKAQFRHWHSNSGSYATATDGTRMFDNSGCGYGKEKDVPVEDVQVP